MQSWGQTAQLVLRQRFRSPRWSLNLTLIVPNKAKTQAGVVSWLLGLAFPSFPQVPIYRAAQNENEQAGFEHWPADSWRGMLKTTPRRRVNAQKVKIKDIVAGEE